MEDQKANVNELKMLITFICDTCSASFDGNGCTCMFSENVQKIADALIREYGYRQQCSVVLEAFQRLIDCLKEGVTGYNVDYFAEVKCYMAQIENEYVKRCWNVKK